MPSPLSQAFQAPTPGAASTAHREAAVAAVTLVGVYLLVFGPGALTSMRVVAGLAAPRAPATWMDRVAALEWDVFTSAVVAIVVVRWLPRQVPAVTRRMRLGARLSRPVPARIVGASAAYVAVAVASTWAGDRVVIGWHLAHGTYTQLGHGTGAFLVAGAAATAAGFTEELTLVALAAAVLEQAFAARGRRSRWAVPATVAVLVTLRWLVHLYYLWGSVFVLAWVPGAYILYRWVGSVWPLVLGHWCYDWLALATHDFPALSPLFGGVLWMLAAAGVVVILVGLGRSWSTRHHLESAGAQ